MKKILSVISIVALIALIFTFAACGNGTKEDIKNDMTSIKNDVTSMMDGVSSAAGDLDDKMTSEGNVTKDNSSTGLLDGMTSENKNTTEGKSTTEDKSTTENKTTKESTTRQ